MKHVIEKLTVLQNKQYIYYNFCQGFGILYIFRLQKEDLHFEITIFKFFFLNCSVIMKTNAVVLEKMKI